MLYLKLTYDYSDVEASEEDHALFSQGTYWPMFRKGFWRDGCETLLAGLANDLFRDCTADVRHLDLKVVRVPGIEPAREFLCEYSDIRRENK